MEHNNLPANASNGARISVTTPAGTATQSAPLEESQYLFRLAQSAAADGHIAKAIDLARLATKINPADCRILQGLGELLLMAQRFTDALDVLKQASALKPTGPEIHFYLALAAEGVNDPNAAAGYYTHAISLQPDWPEAHFNLGTMLHRQGRVSEAIAAFLKAVDLKPDWDGAWLNLGGALEQGGQWEEAHACWQKALTIAPHHPQAHLNCGRYHQRSGRIAAAVESYRRALAIHPGYAKAWYNLASALVPSGQWAEVIDCYQHVIALEPNNDAAHFNLAIALRRQERIGEAMDHCHRALAITPHFAEAKAYLFQLAQHACDWSMINTLSPELDALSALQMSRNDKPAESPLLSLRRHADPQKNLAIARAWSQWIEHSVARLPGRPRFEHCPRHGQRPIRVG